MFDILGPQVVVVTLLRTGPRTADYFSEVEMPSGAFVNPPDFIEERRP